MSESITSIELSISDYIPPAILRSPGSEQIHTKLQRYMKDGWKVEGETTYIGGEIARSVVTKKQVINNIKTVITKTFDPATNKINRITEVFYFNNDVKNVVVEQFDYDAVNKKVSQTNSVEATQDITPQEVREHNYASNKLIQKGQPHESKVSDQRSKSNSSPSDASTLASAETRVKRELLDSKPIKHYEIIDGERFLVTKNGPVVDNGIRVQEVRRDNSKFIADITSKYQNGNIILKTARVREVDPVTKKHSVTGIYKTEYIYDSNNKLDHTFTTSEFYGPDKKQIGLREQRVKNGEIIYDGILRYHSDQSVSLLFLNNDGKYEHTNLVAGKEIGQPSLRQSWMVSNTGLAIPPLESDTINQKATPTAVINGQPPERLKGIVPDRGYPMSSSNSDAINPKATPTAEYPGQLADAINSFPTKERAPTPVETVFSGTLEPRNLVPVMNYASQQ